MLTPVVLLALATSAFAAYYDLTHSINDKTLYWIKDQFVLTPILRQKDPHWVATNKFSTAEHGGTHIDAPFHFNPTGWKLGQVPLSRLFMVDGVLINKTEEVLKDPEYQVTVKDLEDWEKENGPMPNPCVVIVMFGWASRYPDRVKYLGLKKGAEDDWDRHFPILSGEAGKWLAASGKVYGIGTDTVSPDSSAIAPDPIVHKTVTAQNMFILENLNLQNLDGVPARGFKLVILPMKIEEGTAAPAQVVLVTKAKKPTKA